jgi:RNA polymerase sigma-70 factor (ECF subfamily)
MENRIEEDSLYISRFIAGEEEGFEALVRKYQDRVLNIIYSLIRQDRESEDIMQEVFMKVYRSLRAFRQKSSFPTWLYRITVNTVYDFLRRRKKFAGEPLRETSALNCQSPRDNLLAGEKDAVIQGALLKLPFKFRTAVVLKDIEGLSYAEISKVLRCGLGTGESRIFRARQLLKGEVSRFAEDIL